MTAKRYRIYINQKKYDYTYDPETGVARVRLPGMQEYATTQSPTAEEARIDVRQLIERATGRKAKRSPERTQFLRDILCTLAEGGLDFGYGYCVDRTLTAPAKEGGEYTSVTIWYPDKNYENKDTHVVTEDSIASALAKVNNALTEDQRKALDIGNGWRKKMAQANRENDAAMMDAIDAANLAEIAVFGKVIYA